MESVKLKLSSYEDLKAELKSLNEHINIKNNIINQLIEERKEFIKEMNVFYENIYKNEIDDYKIQLEKIRTPHKQKLEILDNISKEFYKLTNNFIFSTLFSKQLNKINILINQYETIS